MTAPTSTPDPATALHHYQGLNFAGATVVLLDHMVKADDGGLWPIGSHRKRAAITGAQYVLEVREPFSKDVDGCVVLKVAKDRHGIRESYSVASRVHFEHPWRIAPEGQGVLSVEVPDVLSVRLGRGKTRAQSDAEADQRRAVALAADVAAVVALDLPETTGYRAFKEALGWKDQRAQDAVRDWKKGLAKGAPAPLAHPWARGAAECALSRTAGHRRTRPAAGARLWFGWCSRPRPFWNECATWLDGPVSRTDAGLYRKRPCRASHQARPDLLATAAIDVERVRKALAHQH